LGDALGLPAEGMSARAIARRFGRVERFRLIGQTGFVSDDTEQAALLAQSLARFPNDPDRCAADFRRSLVGWLARLPWGVGRATVQACGRAALGLRPSGVRSAGNGAAMRAAVAGVFFHDHAEDRRRFGRALAEVTHRDERAVAGALFVAELAAWLARQPSPAISLEEACAGITVTEPYLQGVLCEARELSRRAVDTAEAAAALGTTGFVLHTVPFALFCFLRYHHDPLRALTETISPGGDTDSNAAIVGAWLGALHGEAGLPSELLRCIHDGPFGPTHLRALAVCLAEVRMGNARPAPGYSPIAALVRNLSLWPVILLHGLRRLAPW